MVIGKRPVIGASPSSARAAAVCDTGNPPQATRYVDAAGICWRRYGFPNATTTVRGWRATTSRMNCAIGSGALALDTAVPVDRYELTIVTSDESASASSRSKLGAGSSGFTISECSDGTTRRNSALNVAPAGKSVRVAMVIERTRGAAPVPTRGTSERILGERDRPARGERGDGEIRAVADDRTDRVEAHEAVLVEAQPLLDLEHATDRRVDARLGEAPFANAVDDGVDGRGHVARHEQDVGAGADGELARFADAERVADRAVVAGRRRRRGARPNGDARQHAAHVHRVGDEQPLEVELLSQDAGHDRRIERGGHLRAVERGHDAVEGHDPLDARGDRATERHELHGVDVLAAGVHRGDGEMRVLVGVAVPREVFPVASMPCSCSP